MDPLTNPSAADAAPAGPVAVPAGAATPPWHALETDEAMRRLGSAPGGLGAAEAARRLSVHGPNRLPAASGPGFLRRFLLQFHNLLIYALLAAAVLSAVVGHPTDALVILAVVLINALIGVVQEGRAERSLEAIRAMIDPQASVLRDGRRVTVDAGEVVPGDLVLLDAGDRVPADIRLVRISGLRADEAILTGESVPVDKSPGPVAAGAPLGDRHGMVFSGTFVTAGQGTGLVVATGPATELGRISGLIGSVAPLATPLIRQIADSDDVGRRFRFHVGRWFRLKSARVGARLLVGMISQVLMGRVKRRPHGRRSCAGFRRAGGCDGRCARGGRGWRRPGSARRSTRASGPPAPGW